MNEYVSMVLELCVNILSIIVIKQNLVSICWSLVLHTSDLIPLATTFLILIESHGYCIIFRNKKKNSWKKSCLCGAGATVEWLRLLSCTWPGLRERCPHGKLLLHSMCSSSTSTMIEGRKYLSSPQVCGSELGNFCYLNRKDIKTTASFILNHCLSDCFVSAAWIKKIICPLWIVSYCTLNFKQPQRNAVSYFLRPFLERFLEKCRSNDRSLKWCLTDWQQDLIGHVWERLKKLRNLKKIETEPSTSQRSNIYVHLSKIKEIHFLKTLSLMCLHKSIKKNVEPLLTNVFTKTLCSLLPESQTLPSMALMSCILSIKFRKELFCLPAWKIHSSLYCKWLCV